VVRVRPARPRPSRHRTYLSRAGDSMYPRPRLSELRLRITEIGAAAPVVAALRPAVDMARPRPGRRIVPGAGRLPDPADGHAAPDHREIVGAAVTGDCGDAERE
jgi:hypothetical protein